MSKQDYDALQLAAKTMSTGIENKSQDIIDMTSAWLKQQAKLTIAPPLEEQVAQATPRLGVEPH